VADGHGEPLPPREIHHQLALAVRHLLGGPLDRLDVRVELVGEGLELRLPILELAVSEDPVRLIRRAATLAHDRGEGEAVVGVGCLSEPDHLGLSTTKA
jgi:hypothetical protein